MKFANLSLAALIILSTGCSTIVKSGRQQVNFRGGPDNGVTKVQTPDGTFDIENGTGAYLMTRSKSDIPIKVTCPDGSKKSDIVETKFDWLSGGLGNLGFYFVGFVVDALSDKAYNIKDISLASYCPEASSEPTREVSSLKK